MHAHSETEPQLTKDLDSGLAEVDGNAGAEGAPPIERAQLSPTSATPLKTSQQSQSDKGAGDCSAAPPHQPDTSAASPGGPPPPADLQPEVYYKTRLCRRWNPVEALNTCTHGEHCRYAHGEEDLRGCVKTMLCAKYAMGHCKYGAACRYAHGQDDIGTSTTQLVQNVLCKHFQRGNCTNTQCKFRHEQEEPSSGLEKDSSWKVSWKTELCHSWVRQGSCKYGDNCTFAHGEHEIKNNVKAKMNHKTKLCSNWLRDGSCAYGDRCGFAHGEHEVQRVTMYVEPRYPKTYPESPPAPQETRTMRVREDAVPHIIGDLGCVIQHIANTCGVKLHLLADEADAEPDARKISITGSTQQIQAAQELLMGQGGGARCRPAQEMVMG
ncbi:hypothetical protein CYMTET_8144 [Cymbomonas tetramitiformis]|uniref:C3H1-type domain-containing protein n=1 Tax=Cymbomonas tetramitiformis TaxID=36881 RepID=A0AAE0LGS3_9CHLO|nr:hypothetical protein CYMTET_8144 [Cymbomonas tetramitiformis]